MSQPVTDARLELMIHVERMLGDATVTEPDWDRLYELVDQTRPGVLIVDRAKTAAAYNTLRAGLRHRTGPGDQLNRDAILLGALLGVTVDKSDALVVADREKVERLVRELLGSSTLTPHTESRLRILVGELGIKLD
jgi:predicted polyphosphate/ATP-dependent NAD kinase